MSLELIIYAGNSGDRSVGIEPDSIRIDTGLFHGNIEEYSLDREAIRTKVSELFDLLYGEKPSVLFSDDTVEDE